MNRRDFMKSAIAAGSALLVPTWFGQPAKASLNLQAFCVPYKQNKAAKWKLDEPFTQQSQAGFSAYGTDGKIVARTRTLIDLPASNGIQYPPAHNLDWRHDSELGWKPWPKIDYIEDLQANCIYCRGTGGGNRNLDCATCDGGGQVFVGDGFMQYPRPCSTCNGCGSAGPYCPACKGKQFVRGPDEQRLGHLFIGAEYDHLIRQQCGEAEYVIVRSTIAKHFRSNERIPCDLVLFRFASGEGILCPRTKDS